VESKDAWPELQDFGRHRPVGLILFERKKKTVWAHQHGELVIRWRHTSAWLGAVGAAGLHVLPPSTPPYAQGWFLEPAHKVGFVMTISARQTRAYG